MLRRIHMPSLSIGALPLTPGETHHIRNVLRLNENDEVELFTDTGETARGVLSFSGKSVVVHVSEVTAPATPGGWSIASAVPRGERADWMIEKLSELGAVAFIPLAAARSVVLPEGKNKLQRWRRLAAESAKQSRRAGVMRIAPLTSLDDAVVDVKHGCFLSTVSDAKPVHAHLSRLHSDARLFIGPEGGWTEQEIERFASAGIPGVKLTSTILRVETAAIAAAAIVATYLNERSVE